MDGVTSEIAATRRSDDSRATSYGTAQAICHWCDQVSLKPLELGIGVQ